MKNKAIEAYHGISGGISDAELVMMYERILDGLDRNEAEYSKKWTAISRRRDEIINRSELHSKRIKLKSNWYNPNG